MLGHILNASLSINDKLQDKKKLSKTDQAKITNYKKKLLAQKKAKARQAALAKKQELDR